ncbi:MAG TPA: hypothetical protein VFB72_05625 [Verrucomicrobiae bacterium]|nr:hypothetical protein [Verrucomicrobiae bacterium]
MKVIQSGVSRALCASFPGFLLMFLCCYSAFAQTNNSWIGSSSGDWESPEWSLGLPSAGEDIYINNAGSKVIVIEPTTVDNYPQTMTVHSLTIESPAGTTNSLFLNDAGLETPLSLTNMYVGENSSVLLEMSSLEVFNALSIDGAFIQDSSVVRAGLFTVGDSGTYDLESGILSTSREQIFTDSLFLQQGGTNATGEVNMTQVTPAGGREYDLNGGEFDGYLIISGGGVFKQTGGVINLSGQTSSSTNLEGSLIQPGGTLLQTGGTNYQVSLTLGIDVPVSSWDNGQLPAGTIGGVYTLSNGCLTTANTYIRSVGTMKQSGGVTTITGTLNLQGSIYLAEGHGQVVVNRSADGNYFMSGGELQVSNLFIGVAGNFVQSGGTNVVTSSLSYGSITVPLGPNAVPTTVSGSYSLSGGLLSVPTLPAGRFDMSGGQLSSQSISGGFSQSDGTNEVVSLSPSFYVQSGGLLDASIINLSNGAVFQHRGGECLTYLVTLDNGNWQEYATNGVQLGQLQLGPGTNSIIQFPANNCVITFADSSSLNWSNTGVLTIVNWNGFLSGGGSNQIIFGTNISGLTQQQLSQIQFANPAGLPAGNYLAKILARGEIVPGSRSYLDTAPAPFFTGEASLGNQWFYLSGSNHVFGYFSLQYFPYVYHADMGWEYFIDANNAQHGGYFYDFTDNAFFYTDPGMFPYLYDFNANAWVYYAAGSQAGHYTSSPRWFYNFSTQSWGKHL